MRIERLRIDRRRQSRAAATDLRPLPSSKRDSAPLIQVVERERLRHFMVLSEAVEVGSYG